MKTPLLDKHRSAKIHERLEGIPRKFRPVYLRAASGQGYKAAVHAQCLECCGWIAAEVTNCSALCCPLWACRPYRNSPHAEKRPFVHAESPNRTETIGLHRSEVKGRYI